MLVRFFGAPPEIARRLVDGVFGGQTGSAIYLFSVWTVGRRDGGLAFHLPIFEAALALSVGDGLSAGTEVSWILPLTGTLFATSQSIIVPPILATIAHPVLLNRATTNGHNPS